MIVQDGLRRMYAEGEENFYYLTLYNESYEMPAMPDGVEEGILKGLYKVKPATKGKKYKAHIFGSGPILREALRAQEILAEQFDVSGRCLERDELQAAARRCPAHQALEHAPSDGSTEKHPISNRCCRTRKESSSRFPIT